MIKSTAAVFAELEALDPLTSSTDIQDSESRRKAGSSAVDHEDEILLARILAIPRVVEEQDPKWTFARSRPGQPPRFRRRMAVGVAVVVVVTSIAAGLWWSSPNTNHRGVVAPSAISQSSPRWRLVASLSGPQFQLAKGVPGAVVGVVCSRAPTCFLSTGYGLDYGGGGGMFVSHDDGHTWQPSPLPQNVAITTLASCANSSWCAAGAGLLDAATGDPAAKKPMRDPELMVTTDGGATWTTHPVPIPVDVQQLPAYGNLPAETTYWPGEVDAVSCSAPGVCDVLGQTQVNATDPNALGNPDELLFLRTTDGGAHWTSSVLPERPSESSFQLVTYPGSSEAMSCATTSDCVVIGVLFPVLNPSGGVVDAWRTTDGGKAWQESQLPGVSQINAPQLSCPDATSCWVGPAGDPYTGVPALLRSTDGGVTWSNVPLEGVSGGQGLSCTSSETCYVSGSGIAETTDGGTTWHQLMLPQGVGVVQQISCNRYQTCVAVANPAAPTAGSLNPYNGGSLILTNGPASS